MSEQETGGPAFPVTGYAASNGHSPPKDTWDAGFGGMTLRDYFAAKAMDIAGSEMVELNVADAKQILGVDEYKAFDHYPALVAKYAYKYADAMIAERNN